MTSEIQEDGTKDEENGEDTIVERQDKLSSGWFGQINLL